MKFTLAMVSDRKIFDESEVERLFGLVTKVQTGFDRVWLNYDGLLGVTTVTAFLGKISARFEFSFDRFADATEFVASLNVDDFSRNETALYSALAYGEHLVSPVVVGSEGKSIGMATVMS